jgi:hypothetical protein
MRSNLSASERLYMRVLLAVAVIALGIAGASAADLDMGRGYSAIGYRSAPLVIYDYQPGVVVRAYWLAPWRHHHYFPATGKRPRIGRYENLLAVSRPSKPAKTFRRSWSNAWAFAHELLQAGRDDGKKRVIQADAEVTIHGPDSMNIRLLRKENGSKANAGAE